MGFVLKDSQKEQSLIVLSHNKGLNSPFRYSTGLIVEIKYWDKTSQTAITKGVDKRVAQKNLHVNSELSKYAVHLENVISNARLQSIEITKDYLKEQFNIKFKENTETPTAKPSDIKTIFTKFITDCESGKRLTKKGKRYSIGRLKKYVSCLNNIIEYNNGENLNIYKIDMEFFRNYCEYRYKSNIALNTLAYDFVILKVIIRATYKEDLHSNQIFENSDFRIDFEDVENEYLNDSEIDMIYNYKFDKEYLNRTRDVFVIGCYTGLRVSDLSRLNKNNIEKNGVFKVIPEKTLDPVFIPIHWRVLEILNKYGGNPPAAYSDQKMNDYIKEVCRIAGIDGKAYYKQTRGGVSVKFVEEKWKRISNHTARRSFATNLYIAGFDTISIMKLTGHRTESSFMRYVCITQRQMADKMKDHPYFNK